MRQERIDELKQMYHDHYTILELHDEIRRMEHGDLWDGLSSRPHKEELALMSEVFESRVNALKAQRDELLEVLKEVDGQLNEYGLLTKSSPLHWKIISLLRKSH